MFAVHLLLTLQAADVIQHTVLCDRQPKKQDGGLNCVTASNVCMANVYLPMPSDMSAVADFVLIYCSISVAARV